MTSDYVVVARPDARELAEREGTAGMRGALSELVAGLGGARPERRARPAARADPLLPALRLAAAAAALQVPPDLLGLRRAGGATYGPARGFVLASWRLLRCNPFSDGGYDPVSDQTLFKSRESSASAASPPSRTA